MSNLWKKFEKDVGRYSGYVHPANLDYAINISLKFNYLYTETPKVACSTVKSILQRMELDAPAFYREDHEDIHNRNFSPLLKPSQVGDFGKLVDGAIFKFCFSRNPYSRLASVYLEKIRGNKSQKRDVLLHLGKNPSDIFHPVSFDEFVNVVCEQPIASMDPHWRIQYHQTFQRAIDYDFVGKIEAFPYDLHYVLSKINKKYECYLGDERRHSAKTKDQIFDLYSPSLVKMVRDKFSKDFEFFGYDEEIGAAYTPIQPTADAADDRGVTP